MEKKPEKPRAPINPIRVPRLISIAVARQQRMHTAWATIEARKKATRQATDNAKRELQKSKPNRETIVRAEFLMKETIAQLRALQKETEKLSETASRIATAMESLGMLRDKRITLQSEQIRKKTGAQKKGVKAAIESLEKELEEINKGKKRKGLQ